MCLSVYLFVCSFLGPRGGDPCNFFLARYMIFHLKPPSLRSSNIAHSCTHIRALVPSRIGGTPYLAVRLCPPRNPMAHIAPAGEPLPLCVASPATPTSKPAAPLAPSPSRTQDAIPAPVPGAAPQPQGTGHAAPLPDPTPSPEPQAAGAPPPFPLFGPKPKAQPQPIPNPAGGAQTRTESPPPPGVVRHASGDRHGVAAAVS